LTKIHEAFLRGSLAQVAEYYEENDPKGEYVLIIAGKPEEEVVQAESDDDIVSTVDKLIKQGQKPNKAIKEVAVQNGLKKQDVYNLYHGIGEE